MCGRGPISSPAEGLIYGFCWHHLTGTLVLQMGTGDVVRIINLQMMHYQNDASTRMAGGLWVVGCWCRFFVAAP